MNLEAAEKKRARQMNLEAAEKKRARPAPVAPDAPLGEMIPDPIGSMNAVLGRISQEDMNTHKDVADAIQFLVAHAADEDSKKRQRKDAASLDGLLNFRQMAPRSRMIPHTEGLVMFAQRLTTDDLHRRIGDYDRQLAILAERDPSGHDYKDIYRRREIYSTVLKERDDAQRIDDMERDIKTVEEEAKTDPIPERKGNRMEDNAREVKAFLQNLTQAHFDEIFETHNLWSERAHKIWKQYKRVPTYLSSFGYAQKADKAKHQILREWINAEGLRRIEEPRARVGLSNPRRTFSDRKGR
jgi:hypothetical protein